MNEHNEKQMAELLVETDEEVEYSLRPQTLAEFIGQERVKEQLRIHIEAAKQRAGSVGTRSFRWGRPGSAKQRWRESSPTKWGALRNRRSARRWSDWNSQPY